MFKYFWIVVILLTYVPWTLWTLIDFVRISLTYQHFSTDAFWDWVDEHEVWVSIHLGILVLLMLLSFVYWLRA